MTRPERKRVLFVGEAVTLSHVARPAVLAKALDPDRYEVFLACDPRYNALLGDLPCEPIALTSIPADDFFETLYRGKPVFSSATLERYVHEDLKLFRELSPDVVVGDMRQSLAVSSRLASIPFVNVINAHWSPYADIEFELAEHPLIDAIGEDMAQRWFKLMFPIGTASHTLAVNLVSLKHGLPALGFGIKRVYTYGDYTAYPDVPAIVPTRNLPANHLYLGPILWSPFVERPAWWERVPDDRPIIHVSLGSSGQHRLLAVLLEALAELPVYVLAATAGRSTLGSLPDNAFVADYLPGTAAAERSSLVICNGGTMSGQQALAAGAPILGVVSNLDQLVFMKGVRQVGAGEMLREGNTTVASARQVVSRMLAEPSYRQAAGRVALEFEQFNAAERFRALIQAITSRSQ